MYIITIIPHLDPRQKEARWSRTFEEVPTKQQLQKIIKAQLVVLNSAIEGEDDAANIQRVIVGPMALDILEYGGVPIPTTKGTKVMTVFHDEKRLGSISIQ